MDMHICGSKQKELGRKLVIIRSITNVISRKKKCTNKNFTNATYKFLKPDVNSFYIEHTPKYRYSLYQKYEVIITYYT